MKHALAIALVVLAASCNRDKPQVEHDHTPPPQAAASAAHGDHASHGNDAGLPSGYAAVSLDDTQAAALGIRIAPVEERHFSRAVRTVGVVALDETRTSHVHAKVRGFIDAIHVDFVGKKVAAGQPLCALYSQEVYAAELEFLSVLERARSRPASSAGEFAQAEARAQEQLLEAARRRLSLWDVPKSEIERLERTREARRAFPLLAPRSGVVVEKQALEGMFVDPSTELYTVSDLGRVWVLADLYEADIPFVRVGDTARLTIEGVEGAIEAKVMFLPPTVEESTRTVKARFELPNVGGRLRPGSFVGVTMDVAVAHGLGIPESAVIRTGTRNVVFLAHGSKGQHLEPREVKLGPLIAGFYRIDGGLALGDHVAVGAQFLLDSESRLRATGGGGAHAGH